MFPGTSYFQTFPCPYYASSFCDRPYCHFKHIKPDKPSNDDYQSGNTYSSSNPGYSTGTKPKPPEETVPFSISAAVAGSSQDSGSVVQNIQNAAPAVNTPTNLAVNTAAIEVQQQQSSVPATPSLPATPSAMSSDVLAAAMGPLAALSSVLEKDKLESMIQDAVRKVLLETGAASKLVSQVTAQPKVEVKEEADDDIIVEYCDINKSSTNQFKKESANVTSDPTPAASHRVGPQLCLPPADAPVYIPTPIAELEKRKSLEEAADQTDRDDSELPQIQPGTSSLPGSLLAMGSLHTGERSAVTIKAASPEKKKFSYEPEPPVASKGVLGDTSDISESEGEEQNPDLLGSILKAGSSSGVLTGGKESNFEELVIKEKCKLLKKKLDKKKSSNSAENPDDQEKLDNQCDKVTSSSQDKSQKASAATTSDSEIKEITSDISSDSDDDDLEDKKIKEEQEIIKSLEKKRQMLENFYKSKIKKLQDTKDDISKVAEKQSKNKKSDKDSKSHKSRSRDSSSRKRSRHREDEHRKSSVKHKDRSRHRSDKHKRKSDRKTSSDLSDSETDSSSRKSRSSKKRHSSRHSSHSRHRHKSKKKRKSSSSEYDSETDSTEDSDDRHKRKSDKKKEIKDKFTVKETESIEQENMDDHYDHDAMDTLEENIAESNEYEELPEGADEFMKAELKIKKLLEEKMKAPSMGVFSSYSQQPATKPDEKKVDTKLEPETDIPDVSVFLKSKSPVKKPVVKPELKLRSLTELAADSKSVIDPKTTNIFDHEEESFSDMIKRHENNWIDSAPSAASAEDITAASDTNDNDASNETEDAQTSFLDAISATDEIVRKKAKDNKKRDRSKSDHSSRDRDSKKHKERSSERRRDEKDKRKSEEERRHSDKSKESRSDRHHSSHSSKHKKSSHSSSDRRERSSNREKSSKSKESRSEKEVEAPLPDTTMQESDIPDISEELDQLPDLDADLDAMFNSDAEEEDELQRLFKEYKPDDKSKGDPAKAKMNKQTTSGSSKEPDPGGKKRVAHAGADDHVETRRPLHMRKPQTKTPAQTMMDRFKKIKEMARRQEQEMLGGAGKSADSSVPGPSSRPEDPVPGPSRRVAHQPGTQPQVLSKTKQQLLARHANTSSRYDPESTTAAQTVKGKSRVAHTPTSSAVAALAKPIITADPNSKVPNNIRQRYLDSITTECMNIFAGDAAKAYPRAEKEEMDCSRKASSRMIYLNLVVNKIKKLRSEAKEAEENRSRAGSSGQGTSSSSSGDQGKRSLLTTHMQVLAGRPGTIGTWSIEKPVRLSDEDIDEELMYNVMKKFMLTEQQLIDNGFPRTDPEVPGKAIVKVSSSVTVARPSDPTRRACDRCKAIYRVDKFGKQIDKEDCVYHWGRQHRQRGNRALGGAQTVYYCCQQGPDSSGCQVGKSHVTDVLDYNDMRGFMSTLDRSSATTSGKVFALDCEMCYTTQGNELTRVTVLDYSGEVIYETLVKPENEIVDYNTRFSGITEEDLKDVTTNIVQVQAVLLMKFNAKDILIGHSLESDLKSLKLLHNTVVDTSVVFPHRMGPPFKRALKFLAADHLKRIIQSDEGGHDSKEDALACLDLMKMKVKEEVKRLQKKARLQAMYSNT